MQTLGTIDVQSLIFGYSLKNENENRLVFETAVTYYPHGLQPNMYSLCAVWSIPFHIYA
jgi:hypothetical protein